ncbi:hypothetical protein D3C76_429840 [compost metagenome]
MSPELKDRIGREVAVGDFVAWSGPGTGVDIDIVIQILPKTIRIGRYSKVIDPRFALIVNEQLETSSSGVKTKSTLYEQYKDKFNYTRPKR